MITTKVSYDKTAVELAKEALSARLYVPGWNMNPTLHNIIKCNNSCGYGVAISYYCGKPIAVAIIKTTWNGVLYVFVKRKHRGNGYGRNIAKSLLAKYPDENSYPASGHTSGSIGTDKFFISLGLSLIENYSDSDNFIW